MQQSASFHAQHMVRGRNPQPSICVFRDSEYLLAQRFRNLARAFSAEPSNSALANFSATSGG
jgi:hypothetical protein